MNRFTKLMKIVLVTTSLVVLYALPVFAYSSDFEAPKSAEDVETIISRIVNEAFDAEDAFRASLIDLRPSEENKEILVASADHFHKAMKDYCVNSEYLRDLVQKTALDEKSMDVSLKKEIYDNYVNLSQYNPEFKALADKAYEEYLESQSALEWSKVLNARIDAGQAKHKAFEMQYGPEVKQHILNGDKPVTTLHIADVVAEFNSDTK